MLVLGVEGTAHTFGAAVVECPEDAPPRVLSNVADMHRPDEGGIHPRVAADHHAAVAGDVLRRALAEAGVRPQDLGLVAFSRGPGLGPCLRVAATSARAVALALGVPLLGVNHCVAHLEIGRALTAAEDPVLLYASGGNTQVIAFHEGRYRVFGETLDIGVGNMLDRFARHLGQPFPGGPHVEALAARSDGGTLVELPYTVKGMDVAFSGLMTAAVARTATAGGGSAARRAASSRAAGETSGRPAAGRPGGSSGSARAWGGSPERYPVEDVAFSLQETAFAMLVEVTERALAHLEKDEVVLGGGVACNRRLQAMTEEMCRARGARSFAPERALLVDNGAMIAHLGAVMWRAGVRQDLAATAVDQRERTDDVPAPWRSTERHTFASSALHAGGTVRGAEAEVSPTEFLGRPAVRKVRVPKPYRHPELDRRVSSDRTRREARFLALARRAGVRTPLVYDVDADQATLVLERLHGDRLKDRLGDLASLGRAVAALHGAGLVHGDLTTSNALAVDGGVALLDFGLAAHAEEAEDLGTDLHVLLEALSATHAETPGAFDTFLEGYRAAGGRKDAEAALAEIVRRGRYRGT